MAAKGRDYLGQVFNGILVAERLPDRNGRAWYAMRCHCGKVFEGRAHRLLSRVKPVTSCGCLTFQLRSEAKRVHGEAINRTDEYSIWVGIKQRCMDPADPAFPRYGGRGIGLHEPWARDFSAFLEAVGRRPSRKHSLDRIDNDKGYEPGNVRWATSSQQNQNKRNNHNLTYDGITLCVAEWARRLSMPKATLEYRVLAGWSAERALTTPPARGRNAAATLLAKKVLRPGADQSTNQATRDGP